MSDGGLAPPSPPCVVLTPYATPSPSSSIPFFLFTFSLLLFYIFFQLCLIYIFFQFLSSLYHVISIYYSSVSISYFFLIFTLSVFPTSLFSSFPPISFPSLSHPLFSYVFSLFSSSRLHILYCPLPALLLFIPSPLSLFPYLLLPFYSLYISLLISSSCLSP